ncbi:MAG: tetratricopeptide repeat protein [Halioglobus sp.]
MFNRVIGWRLCFFLAAVITAPLVSGQSPVPYGQDYFRYGQGLHDGRPARVSGFEGETDEVDKEAYLTQLEDLHDGPYSDSLAEPLSALGAYYLDLGRYAEALGYYQRALHVVRVNDGLYSERQIPLVRNLLDAYRLSGDTEALDERYEYFFRLYGSGQPPFTELRLRAALEYLRWQREALGLTLEDDRLERLLKLYHLNAQIVDAAAQSIDITPYWYRQLVLSQIRNLYLLESEYDPPDELYGFGTNNAMQSNQMQGVDFKTQRLDSIRRTSSSRGRILLEGLVARLTSIGDAQELAGAYLELGDWHQWSSDYRSANRAYAQVVKTLQESGDHALLDSWMGSPAELPTADVFWLPQKPIAGQRRVLFSAEYSVSSRGKPRGVQVWAVNPEESGLASAMRRKLLATRFRPRYAIGETEAVEKVTRKYEMIVD